MISGQELLIALCCAGVYYGGVGLVKVAKKVPTAIHAVIHRTVKHPLGMKKDKEDATTKGQK